MKKNGVFLALLLVIFLACSNSSTSQNKSGLDVAVKMADSEIGQFPDPGTVDFNTTPAWNYTQGLIAQAMIKLWKSTGNEAFYNYAKRYADEMIDPAGNIPYYKVDEYSLDRVNSGKFLFDLYKHTNDERYLKAINLLAGQFEGQPRTSEGGFWHKKRYTGQMWLDGLYMGAPFYAEWAAMNSDTAAFSDVINQFVIVHKHTYNPEVGLNYHGWDESKAQRWADRVTGTSPNFWGRAEGWYAMALVDVLDYIPEDFRGRGKIIEILNQVAAGIKKFQDPKTGLWYQVLDQGNREGNYPEATCSSMFTYTFLKGVKKGYLSSDYKAVAEKAWKGILENLVKNNPDGTISLTNCCSVAGLGGDPYRDGSYEYYIHEVVRDNDPKGVGPFIMAGIEMN